MNFKLIKFVLQMDSTGTCNTKLLENDRKYNSQNLSYLNHNLIQRKTPTPTSPKYFESLFRDLTLQWKHIGKKNWGKVTKFFTSD